MSDSKSTRASDTAADAAKPRRAFPRGIRARQDHERPRPWIDNGIDYGPARMAADDLARWAFGLLKADVAGWPEGKRRVRNVRRWVRARLDGRRAPEVSEQDVQFTTMLLIRILDEDLRLGMGDAIQVLLDLELPAEDVAAPRSAAGARTPAMDERPAPAEAASASTSGAPRRALRHLSAIIEALTPSERELAEAVFASMNASEQADILGGLESHTVDDAISVLRAALAPASVSRTVAACSPCIRLTPCRACAACGGVAPCSARRVA